MPKTISTDSVSSANTLPSNGELPSTSIVGTSSGGSSALEFLYNITDGSGKFDRVVDFLGTMAEAESFKGKRTSNALSSASGIFHFLVGNGGGFTKDGKKEKLGQYDAAGVLRTSSFETAKKRLRAMISSQKYADSISKQPVLVKEIDSILKAPTPDTLSPQRQAILAYANLKMKSNDFDNYLDGKQTAEDVYGKVWVTRGSTHSDPEISKNWKNAISRGLGKSHYQFFEIDAPTAFDNKSAAPHPYGAMIPQASYRNGGVITQKIIAKKTLV